MRHSLFTLSMVLMALPAFAIDTETLERIAAPHMPRPAQVGEGELSFLLFDVYDAKLVAPEGSYDAQRPYALSLTYKMDFTGKDIADRSVEEMRGLGYADEVQLAGWHRQMEELFPDVKEGESLIGVRTKQGQTVFYQGETNIGAVKDTGFTEAFFGIWLNEKTSEPKLRASLLGK